MKFPDLIHAVKPEPHHGMPQAASAHDTFWDFASLMPETTHTLLWVMSDRGIPRSLRMKQGFGVHTYRLVNAKGESHFVKFHWTPKLGTHSLVWGASTSTRSRSTPPWPRCTTISATACTARPSRDCAAAHAQGVAASRRARGHDLASPPGGGCHRASDCPSPGSCDALEQEALRGHRHAGELRTRAVRPGGRSSRRWANTVTPNARQVRRRPEQRSSDSRASRR